LLHVKCGERGVFDKIHYRSRTIKPKFGYYYANKRKPTELFVGLKDNLVIPIMQLFYCVRDWYEID
jgi:hypothetical protein